MLVSHDSFNSVATRRVLCWCKACICIYIYTMITVDQSCSRICLSGLPHTCSHVPSSNGSSCQSIPDLVDLGSTCLHAFSNRAHKKLHAESPLGPWDPVSAFALPLNLAPDVSVCPGFDPFPFKGTGSRTSGSMLGG